MNELWIPNASPTIVLAKIERLDLLSGQGMSLSVPEAVVDEILGAPAQDPARRAVESGWEGPAVQVFPDPHIIEWGLGTGETAILSLARQKRATAVVDDRAARTACKALGIRFIGTLGVVLRVKMRGQIHSAVEVLKALQEAGLFLDRDLIQTALRKATGENWPE